MEYRANTVWTHPILDDWSRLDEIQFDPDNKWFRKAMVLTSLMTKKARNKYAIWGPISMALGPGDLAAALRGTDRLMVDFYRYPDEVKRLLDICTRIYIEVIDSINEGVDHPFDGNVDPRWFVWMPCRRSGFIQEDLSVYLSPELYREFIRPFDEEVINHLAYNIYHCDGSWHLISDILKIEKLGILELTDPPKGPKALGIEALRKEKRRKPIMIGIGLDPWEIDEIKTATQLFGHRGLHITAHARSIKEGNDLVKQVEEFASRL